MGKPVGYKDYQHQPEARRAPDVGRMLDEELLSRGLPAAVLARRSGRGRSTIAALLGRASIQTGVLWDLCHALKRNFFADMAAQLPAEYESKALADARAELEQVKAERDLMAGLLRRD